MMHDLARRVAAAQDRALARLLIDALAPFRPVITVHRPEWPADEVRVTFAGMGIRLPYPEETVARDGVPAAVAALAAELRTAWHRMTPADVPDNITLSTTD